MARCDGERRTLWIGKRTVGREDRMMRSLWLSGLASAALLILAGGSEDQNRGLLPAICSGDLIVALAIADSGRGWGPESVETELTRSGDGYVVNGIKRFVQDGGPAGLYICAAREGAGSGVKTFSPNCRARR